MNDPQLDRLMRLAIEAGSTEFWLNALPWLVQNTSAVGGSVLLLQPKPMRHSTGEISEAVGKAITDWEGTLDQLQEWMPEQGALSSTAPPADIAVHPTLPIVHVAIRQRQGVLGGISLVFAAPDRPDRPLAGSVGALVAVVARLATQATENHQLQRRLTRSGLLYELSRTLTSSLEIDVVLQFTTALAANALGSENSALLLIAAEWREFVVAVAHGAAANAYALKQIPIDDGIAGWVAQTGLPMIVNNPQRDPVFSPLLDHKTGYATRNALCAPLQARGNVLGVLMVSNTEDGRDFAVEDMEWLAALAAQASIAIENARLYSSLRDERDRIIQAEEDLRRRLAGNLHDSAAQLVGSLLMNLEVARRVATNHPEQVGAELDLLRDLVQQVNVAIRQSLLELRPLMLESRGLAGALRGFVNQQRRLGFAVTAEIGDLPEIPNRHVETALYLIAQEALSNARRHARSEYTWLRIWIDENWLILEVEDDGRGISREWENNDTPPTGMGLVSIRERVEWLGGQLLILSPRPGQQRGTLVRARISLARLLAPPPRDQPSRLADIGT
ncbi:MAG: GAF domain-containing protein [Anaerolineae bacterium]|nr:GAF domain-containing protein [Anaerolineae bacterium]MCB0245626.1 GAF domain-containing protein [Anaerolineae bacterium]MCB0247753.1 GAF domain-containing protein [Anaerolineae bacterium]MCB9132139.1 GAF domain-containing protein [Anaerolineales bacterium]